MSASPSRPGLRSFGLSAWCIVAAFGTYFCMYGFRKPFGAATFDTTAPLWGLGFKSALVIAQTLGYGLSKFAGIKVIAEMTRERRAIGILILVGIAQAALLLFGLVPPPWNVVFLFVNGLPLGMVFGLVLGYLEGRQATEALTAGLCASFILADDVTKWVGGTLHDYYGVPEMWMPFVAGLIFLLPLLVFVWMLTRIPNPSAQDVAHRSQRVPMNGTDRRRFLGRYAFGLALIVLVYLLITILRSVRSDFGREIWNGLGYPSPDVFFWSGLWVTTGVTLISGLAVLIINNRAAFFTALGVSILGLFLIAAALWGLHEGWLDGFTLMVIVTLGLYIPYVATHTTIFERLIAMTRDRGNIGFLMYVADAVGYLGYVAVLLGREYVKAYGGAVNFLEFFVTASWVVAPVSVVFLVLAWVYFARLTPRGNDEANGTSGGLQRSGATAATSDI